MSDYILLGEPSGAYYSFRSKHGWRQPQVPRESRPGCAHALRAPGTLTRAFFLGGISLGGSPREPPCQAGPCEHPRGGPISLGDACTPRAAARATLSPQPLACLMSIRRTSGCHSRNRLLLMSRKCITQQGRHNESTRSPLQALGPWRRGTLPHL